MIRVKGSTMTFGGAKLTDPKITITKYNASTSTYDSFLTVDNWGAHASTATSSIEIMVVEPPFLRAVKTLVMIVP